MGLSVWADGAHKASPAAACSAGDACFFWGLLGVVCCWGLFEDAEDFFHGLAGFFAVFAVGVPEADHDSEVEFFGVVDAVFGEDFFNGFEFESFEGGGVYAECCRHGEHVGECDVHLFVYPQVFFFFGCVAFVFEDEFGVFFHPFVEVFGRVVLDVLVDVGEVVRVGFHFFVVAAEE